MPQPASDLNTYRALHAAHYDTIYAEKPYGEEARFVVREVERFRPSAAGTRLLDVACGTGRHAVEFAALGYSVTGVDYNEELLLRARENAAARGLDIRFVQQDMRALDLDGEVFDVVTCLFDSIGYPGADQGVQAALTRSRKHLGMGGVLAVEFLHAPAFLGGFSPVRVGRWELPDGAKLIRISESRLDVEAGLLVVDFDLIQLDRDGARFSRSQEQQENRFFTLDEMRTLLEGAGLQVEAFLPAYESSGVVTPETWHVLALAVPAP